MKSENISDFFARKEEKKTRIKVEAPMAAPARKIEPEKVENIKRVEKNPQQAKFFARFFDGGLKLSIILVFLGLPVYFTGQTFQGLAFERQMYFFSWTLLGVVFWVARGLVDESIKIRRTPLDIPILLFGVAYLASAVFSVDRWHSFWGWFGDPSRGFLGVMAIIAFYYLFLSNFTEKLFRWALGAFIFSGLLAILYAALRIKLFGLTLLPAKWLAVLPLSPLGSFHGLGIFLGMMILLLITLLFRIRANQKMQKFGQWLATTALVFFLVLGVILLWSIYSYTPIVGVAVALVFLLIFILSKLIKVEESWNWLPMLTFVALMIMILLNRQMLFGRMELPNEASWPSYASSWEIAKGSLKDAAIFGSGPATYGYDFSKYKPQNLNLGAGYELRYFQGQGVVLEALSTVGILGVFALLVLVLSYVGLGLHYLFASRNKEKVYSLGLFVGSLALIINALFFHIDGAALLLGAVVGILAMAILLHENESEEKFAEISLKASAKYAITLAFVFIAVVTAVVFIFVFLGKSYTADIYAKKSFEGKQITLEESIKNLKKATELFGKEGNYQTLLGYQYMLLANQEAAKKDGSPNAFNEYLSGGVAYSKRGAELMKNDVSAVMSLGLIYENKGVFSGNYTEAEATYQRALELDSHSPNAYLKLGQIKFAQGNLASKVGKDGKAAGDGKNFFNEAQDFFQKSIDEKKDFAAGYLNLALAQEKLGNLDSAIENAQKVALLEGKSGSVNTYFILAQLHQARGTEKDLATAENYFKQILGVNNKEVNTHLNLGILYDNSGRKSEAVEEYRQVLKLLPDSQAETKTKIQEMIDKALGVSAAPATPEESVESVVNEEE